MVHLDLPYWTLRLAAVLPPTSPDTYSYTDVSRKYSAVQGELPVPSFSEQKLCLLGEPDISPTQVYLLEQHISLPDGSHFTISYEATPSFPGDVTGRISQLTLPTGGWVSYAYSGGNNGINCTTHVPPVLTRTTNDNNGHSSSWSFTNNNTTLSGNYSVREQDPAGNQTVYNF